MNNQLTQKKSNTSIATTSQTYEDFYTSIENSLNRNAEWNSNIPNEVSSTLLSILASLGASFEAFAARKIQEGYLETAQSPLGIYTAARSISGRLFGNNPSIANISYIVDSSYLGSGLVFNIPPNSLFNINGSTFYNSDYLLFNTLETYSGIFNLIEGQQNTISPISDGNQFQKFYVSNSFKSGSYVIVSAIDPLTMVNKTWTRVDSLPSQGANIINDSSGFNTLSYVPLAVYESYLYPDGTLCINFGDGVNGAIPPTGSNISITYYESTGGALNNIFQPNNLPRVTLVSSSNMTSAEISQFNQVYNCTCSAIVGGSKPPSYLSYKVLSPSVYASSLRQVSPPDFQAAIQSFTMNNSNIKPIKACRIITEREFIKDNPMLVNTVVPVMIMDLTIFEDEQFKTELSNMLSLTSCPSVITPILYEAVPFNIEINIGYNDFSVDEQVLRQLIKTSLIDYIKIYANDIVTLNDVSSPYWYVDEATNDLLGKTYYLSDFYNLILSVIGANSCIINYSYNGSSNRIDLKPYQCLAFDFSNGKNPIKINITQE